MSIEPKDNKVQTLDLTVQIKDAKKQPQPQPPAQVDAGKIPNGMKFVLGGLAG